jgi:N-methylhydantoinase B
MDRGGDIDRERRGSETMTDTTAAPRDGTLDADRGTSAESTDGRDGAAPIEWDARVHSYRPGPDWRSNVSPKIEFFSDVDDDLDPVTFEVLRNRLWTVNIAHAETITRISGSPIMQALDFNPCILSADAELVMNAPFIQYLDAGAPLAIKYVLERYSDRPGIDDGDVYIQNDPWIGAAHQMDVNILHPVFIDGKLFAWTSNAGHQIDLGGVVAGGWPQNAVDVYHDPVLFTPFKIVERGELREDLERMYRGWSRMPDLVALDLRAQLAGCRFAANEIVRACEEFGPPTVMATMQRILDNAQRSFVEKLRRIPDGTWSEVRYFDEKLPGDRTTHRMQVNVTKKDDRLIVDNKGTEEQSEGPNGFTYAAFSGGVMGVIAVSMAWDQLFALGGVERQIDFNPEPGLLTCVDRPAAVSAGVLNILTLMNALQNVFGRMLACDPDLKADLTVSPPDFAMQVLEGINDRGTYTATALLDGSAGMAGGARAFLDGVHTTGPAWSPMMRLLNAENVEEFFPIVYLYRRERRDATGAGTTRGGTGTEFAFTPYRAKTLTVTTNVGGMGVSTHNAPGLFGALPAPTARQILLQETNVREILDSSHVPQDVVELQARDELLLRAKTNHVALLPGDVMAVSQAGGGGYGDPLERDPARVAEDVVGGYVSKGLAEAIYGVVLGGDDAPDDDATDARRKEIRAERAGWPPATDGKPTLRTPRTGGRAVAIHEYIEDRDDDAYRVLSCTRCGHVVGDHTDNYKCGLLMDEGPVTAIPLVGEPRVFLDEDIVLRRYCCPGCHVMMAAEVVRATEPILADTLLA